MVWTFILSLCHSRKGQYNSYYLNTKYICIVNPAVKSTDVQNAWKENMIGQTGRQIKQLSGRSHMRRDR